MNSVTLTPAQLASLATAVHAISTDKVTPILGAIQFERTGETITATSTDRYRVARITLQLSSTPADDTLNSETFTVQLDGKAFDTLARSILKNAGRAGETRESVTLEHDSESGRVTIRSAFGDHSATVPTVAGNFPPVARLYPSAEMLTGECGAVSLNPAHLTTMTKLTLPQHDKATGWIMERQPNDGTRAKPVLFTVTNNAGRIEYLVQPQLMR